ncbi:aminotransferase class I/II-fold pyridoxal phosphate-dependent enzyme [Agrobacterium tumefaciens]|uniref:Aminotransferase class I/II-fold pyridoxal phosphate-dependent enzyme n=1 Tax=Agrobacterium tumefaciens TaxID=358 RepID=A0A9Q5DK46_AGRTU|nr:aminotransferase class I/II-fold pyridoxal phosphate-dependent enzyme [Agrobacterium tumefaciens]NSL24014.1 aminotransferase class I/II-fold pyridoxal phosphate-dependent enzyme [Agrobacterium tumefaciens]NSY51280.1 aminotransferase class I/II-fold pyridoxal phosphate-dependent enzyme [Agrobacterium tumefaciens]NTA45129.1 aminotransferase class I/II-fold pyridoxal phosphate-dependent enzyme [Agrobacterium tumefaciens]NTB87275.1 aminotransferase class I/II-fold pyridoxal phosphate-dependent e
MVDDENGDAGGTKNAGADYLSLLRDRHEAAGQNRLSRVNRRMPERIKAPKRFEDLAEYKKILAQKAISGLAGVDNPFYRSHEMAAGATTRIGGREVINFASYDYLATNSHPAVHAAAIEAIDKFGISASASRLVAGERPQHGLLEQKLASIYEAEASVCFVSGYLTNSTVISCVMGPKDLVIHDELIHNSVLAGIKLSGATRRFFRHNDTADLENILMGIEGEFERVLVVVEGVYSMDGDVTPLPHLVGLRGKFGFWLMVDEAHALGVLGEKGRGTFEHFGIDPSNVDIWMGTLSKTASSCGGYVAGCSALIQILKANAGGFVYSVGLPPVLASSALASLSILENEPDRVAQLRENGRLFLDVARRAGLDTGTSGGHSIVPVIVGDSLRAVQLSNELLKADVNALPIIYPAVQEGMARIRFFLTSDHTRGHIETAVNLTANSLNDLLKRNVGLGSLDMQQVAKLFS